MGLLLNILFGKPKEKPQDGKRDLLDDLIMIDEIFADGAGASLQETGLHIGCDGRNRRRIKYVIL